MKSFKKVLVSLLICALLFGTVGPVISFADDSLQISGATLEAAPNSEVTLPISFNSVSVGAFRFDITFDASKLTFVSCTLGEQFSSLVNEGEAIFLTNSNSAKDGTVIIGGAITRGAVFTEAPLSLVFEVKATESTSTEVTIDVPRIVDEENNAIANTVTNGTINIVAKPLEDILFDNNNKFLEVGDSFVPTYNFAPADHTDAFTPVWKSENTEIATVDEEGNVTAIRVGTTSISLTCGNITKSFNLTVTSIEVSDEVIELNAGESTSLEVSALPLDTPFTYEWTSLNEEVATVENGVVTGVSEGEAQISLLVLETGKTYTFTVNVKIPYIKGDLDNDKLITVSDALYALRIAAKLVSPTETDILIGDVDGDASITVSDALSILRVAAKLSDSL